MTYTVKQYFSDSGTWHPAPGQGLPFASEADALAWIATQPTAEYRIAAKS